jgi:hypothetical protein
MATSRVLVLGDALRLSFQDRLARLVSEDGLEVVGPAASCGDAQRLAEGAEGWATQFTPDLAAFGCGPWAAETLASAIAAGAAWSDRLDPLSLPAFEQSLMETVRALTRACGRQVVYWTTPPVHEARVSAATGDRDAGHRINAWIAQYNQLATSLMGELNVAIADLHHDAARHDDDALGPDGVSLTEAGIEMAARIVATGLYGVIHP